MSLIEKCIGEARARNVILYIKDGQLAFIAEKGGFPEELKARIGKHKREIIDALLSQASSASATVEPFALLTEEERQDLGEGYADAYPMSALQVGMVFHSELEKFAGIFHDIMSRHVRYQWDRGCFERALAECIEEQPVLRTGFRLNGARPLQHVHAAIELPLTAEDLRGQSAKAQDEFLAEWRQRRRRHVFDWEKGPLFHVYIFRRTEESFEFVLSFHHSVLDGWSRAALTTMLYNRYERLLSGQRPEPSAVDWTYRQFIAEEQRALNNPAAKVYFAGMLHGAPAEQLPHLQPADAERVQQELFVAPFQGLSGRLIELAKTLGVPIQAVLLAAHFRVLSTISGQTRAVTCVTHNGRPEAAGAERSLGLFLNSLPQSLELIPGSWRSLIVRVARMNAASMEYRGYPLARIQQQLGLTFSEVLFNYTHFHIYSELNQSVSSERKLEAVSSSGLEQTNFDFVVDVSRGMGDTMWLTLMYNGQALEAGLMERLGRADVEAVVPGL